VASLGRATALLASGTLVSRVLGFGRQWMLVQALGTVGFVTDAFSTANNVPNTIFAIISQGLLNAVLIPQLVRAANHKDGGQAYINKLVTLGILVFGAITVVATLLAPQLIFAYNIHGAKATLATAFAYWSLPQIFFYGLYTLLGEVLNARKSFGPFTWAPVLNNVVSIASLIVFIAVYGPGGLPGVADWSPLAVFIVAGGATLGIAAQALILTLFWRRVGLRFRFDFAWRGMGLRSVGTAAGWTFAMLLCTQVAGWFETVVANSASGHHRAGVTVMTTTWLLFMLPYSIIAVSIVTAYFTRMSEHARDNDMESFKADYSQSVRAIVLSVSVCAAVLIVTAIPVARIFSNDLRAINSFAYVLMAFVVGLVPFVIGFVTLRAFYSLGDTRSPFLYTLVQSLIVVAGLFVCFTLPLEARVFGIALTVSIAGTVQTALAMLALRRRLHGLEFGRVFSAVLQGFAAAAVATIVGFGVLVAFVEVGPPRFITASFGSAVITSVVVAIVMLAVYVALLRAFRTPELLTAIAGIRRRLGRSQTAE
jgi:putative peptidoglycan lipid II flippase